MYINLLKGDFIMSKKLWFILDIVLLSMLICTNIFFPVKNGHKIFPIILGIGLIISCVKNYKLIFEKD